MIVTNLTVEISSHQKAAVLSDSTLREQTEVATDETSSAVNEDDGDNGDDQSARSEGNDAREE
jgi:hypothetical protein